MIEHGVRGIGASSGAVLVRTDDGQLSVVAVDGMPADVAARYRRLSGVGPHGCGGRRARRPAGARRQTGSDARGRPIPSWSAALDVTSALALPLLVEGEAVGAFVVHFADRRQLRPDERAYLDALARMCVHAFERTRLYERARFAASELQHALLPSRLPAIPGVTLATRYLPELGGLRRRRRLVRRPAAALRPDRRGRRRRLRARACRLRLAWGSSATRCAPTCSRTSCPGQALARLTRLAHAFDDGPPATVACAVFDPHSGSLQPGQRGAPAAAPRCGADGSSELLEIAPGPPVGSFAAGRVRRAQLLAAPRRHAGALLGRRRRGARSAARRRLRAAARRRRAGGRARCRRAREPSPRWPPRRSTTTRPWWCCERRPAASSTLPCPRGPPASRAFVTRSRTGSTPSPSSSRAEQVADVLLAVSEACANAVLHAYDLEDGELRVEASFDSRGLVVRIADDGRWRPAAGGRARPGYDPDAPPGGRVRAGRTRAAPRSCCARRCLPRRLLRRSSS